MTRRESKNDVVFNVKFPWPAQYDSKVGAKPRATVRV